MREPEDDSPRADAEAEALERTALWILFAYLCAVIVPMVRWSAASGAWWPSALHLLLIGTVGALAGLDGAPRWARAGSPLLVAPFLYIELRWVIPGAGRPHSDALVMSWEAALFPSDPSQTLASAWGSPFLSEVLHASYVSYYLLMYAPPVVLWLRGHRRALASTLVALAVVYAVCFLVYVLFPVDGPRFVRGPAVAPDGPIRAFVLSVLESGSSRGTAFPSSHVAASVVAAISALRFQRIVGVVVSVLLAGLSVGAVYGGYHYAVDIVAGLLTGLACAIVAYRIERHVVSARAVPR